MLFRIDISNLFEEDLCELIVYRFTTTFPDSSTLGENRNETICS